MNWIEWNNCLINLDFVKTIYWDFAGLNSFGKDSWNITIVLNDKEGKYVRYFETEEEVTCAFEYLKEKLGDVCQI